MRSCLQTLSKVAKVKFLNGNGLLLHVYFCFLYLWVLSYRNLFLMSRLFQKFLKFFENSTGPDKKKTEAGTRPGLYFLIFF